MANELITRIKLESKDFIGEMKDVKTATLAVSGAVTTAAVGVMALTKAAADQIDAQAKMARSAGTTISAFSGLAYSAQLADISNEELAKGMGKLTTDKARQEMAKLGISLNDASGKAKTQTQIMFDLADKINQAPDALRKAEIAMNVFGKSGGKFVSLLADGAKGLKDLMQEADDLGQVFSDSAGKNAEEFNDNLTRLELGVTGVRNVIGQSIIQWVNQTGVIQGATNVVKGAISWWRNLDDSTKNLVITAGAVVSGMAAITTGAILVSKAISFIAPAIKAAFVGSPVGVFAVAIGLATTAVIYMYQNWAKFQAFFAPAVKVFTDAKNSISAMAAQFRSAGSILQPITAAFAAFKSKLADIDLVATGIKAALASVIIPFQAVAAGVRLVAVSFEQLVAIGGEVYTTVKATGTVIGDFVRGDWDKLSGDVDKLGVAFEGVKGRVRVAVGAISNSISESGASMAATLRNVVTRNSETSAALEKTAQETSEHVADFPKAVEQINNPIVEITQNAQRFFEAFGQKNWAGAIEGLKGAVSGTAALVQNLLSANVAVANTDLTNFKQSNEFKMKAVEAFEQARLDATMVAIDGEIAATEAQKESLLAMEAKFQEDLKALKDKYSEKRKEELDEELRGEFERLQLKYDSQVAALEAAGLSELEIESRKQGFLVQLEGQKNQLVSQSRTRLANDTKEEQARLETEAQQHAKETKKKEEELAAHITELEAQKTAAKEASELRKQAMEKQTKLVEWNAGRASFELGKRAQIAQAVTGMAMGVMQAVQAGIMVAASIPVVGWVMGPALTALLSGLVLAAGSRAISAASQQQYPPPPVFKDGGIATRPSIFGEAGEELAIPMKNPGKDFGALKSEVAKQLLPGGGGTRIDNVNVINHFAPRDDYETIRDKISMDIREAIRSVAPAVR